MSKSLQEKLGLILPHWVEHNRSHAAEFSEWADNASKEGMSIQIIESLREASRRMHAVEHCLGDLARSLGVPMSFPHGEAQHHHHE